MRVALGAAAVAVVLCVSACGPATQGPSAAAAAQRQMMAYARCMRSHGIPDYPDPRNGGYQAQASPTRMVVNGVTLKESQAQIRSSQNACRKYEQAAAGGGAPDPQLQRQALAFAQCMRAHGVPSFPDPKVTGHSIRMAVPASAGQSPLFKTAQRACQSLMPRPGH